jgi:hypothetical protein
MRAGVAVALAVALSAGCKKPPADAPGKCMALPPAERSQLVVGPDGESLYWLEEVRVVDFEAESQSYYRLMRFDFRTRRVDVVMDHAAAPVQFIAGEPLLLESGDDYRLVLIRPDGQVQELTPSYLDVFDFEIINDHAIAFLAEGDGKRAIYTLDLNEPRPAYLLDADVLLSTHDGNVYARVDELGVIIDPKTGKRDTFVPRKHAEPVGDIAYYVDSGTVKAESMSTGRGKAGVATPGDWKLVHQADSVLVRTPVRAGRSSAWLLRGDQATPLPDLVGGTSLLGVATRGAQTWAVVGHNSSNFVRDLGKTSPEADICLLPETGDVSFPTRQVPGRYADKEDRLFAALADVSHDATVQIIDNRGEPTTVYIDLKKEFGAQDLDGMRARVHSLHQSITALLRDPEVRTTVHYADRRLAVERWRRNRLRDHVSAGMGDALIADPKDFDVEVRDLDNKRENDRVTCAGTLVNLQARKLEHVTLRCSANRKLAIDIGDLEPNASKQFSETFTTDEDGVATFEAFSGRSELEVRHPEWETRDEKVLAVATDVYAATRLALQRHTPKKEDKTISVGLLADLEFDERSWEAREQAAATAFKRYEALRDIYGLDASSELYLHIEIDLTDISYDYDGKKLTRSD